MSINSPGCGLSENDGDFREINIFLSKIPVNFFFNYLLFSECLPNSLVDLSNFQKKSTETLIHSAVAFQTPAINKMAIKSQILLFTIIIIIVPLIHFSLCDVIK